MSVCAFDVYVFVLLGELKFNDFAAGGRSKSNSHSPSCDKKYALALLLPGRCFTSKSNSESAGIQRAIMGVGRGEFNMPRTALESL